MGIIQPNGIARIKTSGLNPEIDQSPEIRKGFSHNERDVFESKVVTTVKFELKARKEEAQDTFQELQDQEQSPSTSLLDAVKKLSQQRHISIRV